MSGTSHMIAPQHKAFAQAAVDVEDIDAGFEIARMAFECGADWIEIGTPLLFRYGYEVIGAFHKALGKDATLIADFKFPYGMFVMDGAAQYGADYVLVGAGYQEELVEDTVKKGNELGVTPVFHLSVHPRDYTRYADLYADMGAKYFFTHHYYNARGGEVDEIIQYNNLQNLRKSQSDIRIIVTNDDFEDAIRCVEEGADGICFGKAIHTPNMKECQRWIDAIHQWVSP